MHGELLKLVVESGETSVSKYMVRRRTADLGVADFPHNHVIPYS
jgi:hypothetical protein